MGEKEGLIICGTIVFLYIQHSDAIQTIQGFHTCASLAERILTLNQASGSQQVNGLQQQIRDLRNQAIDSQ